MPMCNIGCVCVDFVCLCELNRFRSKTLCQFLVNMKAALLSVITLAIAMISLAEAQAQGQPGPGVPVNPGPGYGAPGYGYGAPPPKQVHFGYFNNNKKVCIQSALLLGYRIIL